MEKLQHIISSQQFVDRQMLEDLFFSARAMERDDMGKCLLHPLGGRILATLFYEPSTRTRFSFEAAMQKLGGGVLTAENMRESSSAVKGETIADTIRVVSGYADAIVIRHYEEGTAEIAARLSPVPVINAGDGAGEHPTQALIDLYTIQKELGRLRGLRIALVGDLRNGRTIHSLLPMFRLFPDVRFDLIAPAELRLPAKYLAMLDEAGIRYTQNDTLTGSLDAVDVVYITRVQRERFDSEAEYERVKDIYIVNASIVEQLKTDAIIMHALPRVNEIAPEIDTDARAAYFRQAKNGLYLRMALLNYLLA